MWIVEYWHADNDTIIEDWFESLSQEQFKSIAKELKLLERCGNFLRLPHSRSLGEGLFELRERRFGFRIYYTFSKNKVIILFNGGDKHSQDQDIKTARKYLDRIKL